MPALGTLADSNDTKVYKISTEELRRILRRAGKFKDEDGQEKTYKRGVGNDDLIGKGRHRFIRFLQKDFEGDSEFKFGVDLSNLPSASGPTDHSSKAIRNLGTVLLPQIELGKFSTDEEVTDTTFGGRRKSRRRKTRRRKTRR